MIQQESGGQEYRYGRPIVSGAGAMGLMQLMPATYADMQAQNSLGDDPFEPHDNIMAGTAYIRLMYDRYGAPAFLAAYNAGPQRLDDYLNTGRSLPNETVDYVASIAPNLGAEVAMSGPLATYADNSRNDAYVPRRPHPSGSPPGTCRRRGLAGAASAGTIPMGHSTRTRRASLPRYAPPSPTPAAPPAAEPAFEPPPVLASAIYVPAPQVRAQASTYATRSAYAAPPTPAYGDWSIQVGAYNSPDQARFATTMARQAAYAQLAATRSLVMQTSRFGGAVLYRARLAGLARPGAGAACAALGEHAIPCMVVAPGG